MWNVAPYFGWFAGVCTTVSFAPQILTVFRTTNTGGISMKMLVIHITGASSWIIYGALIQNRIMICFNSITFLFITIIMGRCMYLKWWWRPPSETMEINLDC
jgi:MtN3 and saliva related transmembrane protein